MVTTWLPAHHSETMWTGHLSSLVWPTAPFHLPLQPRHSQFNSKPKQLLTFTLIFQSFNIQPRQHPALNITKHISSQTRAQHLLSVPPSGRCGLYAVWYGVVCSTVDVLVRLQGQLLIAGQAEDCQWYPAERSPWKSTSWKMQAFTAVC